MSDVITAYFDWCPRSTYSIGPRTYRDSGDEKQFEVLRQYAEQRHLSVGLFDEVRSVFFAYRTDGFFAFGIKWKEKPRRRTEFNVASVVAQFVKTELGHVHFYDHNSSSVVRLGEWRPHHKYPVKLDPPSEGEITSEYLESLLEDETALVGLHTGYYPLYDGEQNGGSIADERHENERVLVLALIREKYARLFDKTYLFIRDIKETPIFGIPIYRSAFLFILLFLLLVFGFTIHDFWRTTQAENYSNWLLLYGFVNAVANIVVFFILLKVLEPIRKFCIKSISSLVGAMASTEGRIRLKFTSRAFRLPRKNDLIVIMVFAGPHLFSASEVPNAIDVLKLFKVDVANELLVDVTGNLQPVSIRQALANDRFWNDYILTLALYAPFAVIIFYTVDISSKRRKILKALRALKGHLLYGNILDSVVNGLYRRCSLNSDNANAVYEKSGFDNAIRIVDDRISLELWKRARVQITLSVILVLSFIVWAPRIYDLYWGYRPDPEVYQKIGAKHYREGNHDKVEAVISRQWQRYRERRTENRT